MKPKLFLVSTLLMVFFFFGHAFPWGDVGHKTVAYIAEQNISPATLEKIKPLLAGASLESVSTWPDQIRPQRPETGPWHYINIPVRQDITVKDLPNYYTVNGQADNNVISQIKKDIQVLKDSKTGFPEKQEALKFLVHFMGDMHMPLHCGDDNDRGGNEKKVLFFSPTAPPDSGVVLKLHFLWDELIEIKTIEAPLQLGARLNKEIQPADKQQWGTGTVEDWAFETYRVAKEVIYPGFAAGPTPAAVPLPKNYYGQMRPYVDAQLEKAGIRLARTLEDIFGK